MKELSILNDKGQQVLLQTIEEVCGIHIPRDTAKFGTLSFHLYGYSHSPPAVGVIDTCFHIRWGIYTIFKSKHLKINPNAHFLADLQKDIRASCRAIRKEFHRYAEEQLRSIVSIELEPQLQRRFTGLHSYRLGLCQGRQSLKKEENHGWPNYCIYISWYDELDDFQEFLYPLKFDKDRHTFSIPVKQILDTFQRFRDTIV
ncbi:MAG TPA: hypothetical protein EYP36_12110 [Calditrichaeota bacterium]|nr:hypothetical protein [Calditrichota bacterium]